MTAQNHDDPVQDVNSFSQEFASPTASAGQQSATRLIAWAITSLLVLGFLIFGSIPAIRYEYDIFIMQLFIDRSRESILHIWTYQVENLPSIGSQLLVQILFLGAVAVFLSSVIAGLWILLNPLDRPSTLPSEPVDAT